jgi:predicted ATP-dependent Lon-type protease
MVITQGAQLTAVPVWNVSVAYLGGNVYIVRGSTSPGANVRISGRETTAAGDGLFQVQITAAPGLREVSVEATDLQGNSSQHRFPVTGSS